MSKARIAANDPAMSNASGYNMMEMGHTCDAQHIGHRRNEDGTCCGGEWLGYDCEVHGPTRRISMREWLTRRGEPVSDLMD